MSEIDDEIEADQIEIPQGIINYLQETSPWLRFCGIVNFINAVFLIISGFFVLIGERNYYFYYSSGSLTEIVFVIYIILAVIVFVPGYFMFMSGTKLRNAIKANSTQELELAFSNNKFLWKYTGILMIITLSLAVIGIIFAFSTSFFVNNLFFE